MRGSGVAWLFANVYVGKIIYSFPFAITSFVFKEKCEVD